MTGYVADVEAETEDEVIRPRPSRAGLIVLAAVVVILFALYVRLTAKYELPLWAEATLLAALAIAVAHLGLSLLWRIYPPEQEDNDAVNAAFATVAAMYALLFGFVIVVVWQAHADTESAVTKEVNALTQIQRMAVGFDTAHRDEIQGTVSSYVQNAIDEWPLLNNGESNAAADADVAKLWSTFTGMTDQEKASPLYSQSLARMGEIGDNRQARLEAGSSAVPDLMWMLLFAGAVLTVFLAYLFRVSSTVLQRILVTLMTGVMVLALFLVAALDKPYDSRMPITPESFEQIILNP